MPYLTLGEAADYLYGNAEFRRKRLRGRRRTNRVRRNKRIAAGVLGAAALGGAGYGASRALKLGKGANNARAQLASMQARANRMPSASNTASPKAPPVRTAGSMPSRGSGMKSYGGSGKTYTSGRHIQTGNTPASTRRRKRGSSPSAAALGTANTGSSYRTAGTPGRKTRKRGSAPSSAPAANSSSLGPGRRRKRSSAR